jgi:hypothetical protein
MPRTGVRQVTGVVASLFMSMAAHTPKSDARPLSIPEAPGLVVQAPTSSSAVLDWVAVDGAATYQVLREGRLIDVFPAGGATTYTDYLLWPQTSYGYDLLALDGAGKVLADLVATVVTPALAGAFPRFYSRTSFWNTPIGKRPALDPASKAMVRTSLASYRNLAQINDDDVWGIPLAYANPVSEQYDVGCTMFNCQTNGTSRIPRYAEPNSGWDGHLAVFDPSTGQELDMWQGVYDPDADTWSASGRTVTAADWGAACALGIRCGGGGTAAGFLELGGVIRPEEILQGHIDHALTLSTPYVRARYIACPATNYWASEGPMYFDDPNAVPLGAHVQLDPKFNVDVQSWPEYEKIVARALQKYGAYITDVSGTLELRGEANLDRGYDAWSLVGMPTTPHPSTREIPWNRFRVLEMTSC